MSEATPAAALAFRLSEDGTKLLAVFDPAGERIPLDVPAIQAALDEQGLAALFIDDSALARLVKQYNSATEGFVLQIGERHDGQCAIKTSSDRMSAWLNLTAPQGGNPVTREQIDRALREKSVVSGILEDEIEAALAQGWAKEHVVARGRQPVHGTDAQFQSLVPETKERRPQVDEHGIADYRNLGEFVMVKPGDPLMRHLPPTPGENGHDIFGQPVFAKAGRDIPFAPALHGTTLDPQDRNLLVSAITGQPVLTHNGVMVEPTINLPQVDISTGNVNFEGTVSVKGDVKAGMKIRATGDVIVEGTVESAEIEAGGNIVVKGGIIGSGESRGAPGKALGAYLRSNGTVSARFLENVRVRASIDILIDEFAMNSDLIALNQVVVGKSGGKKGHIRGGQVCATVLVKAAVIGSPNGVKTKIWVGPNSHIQGRLAKLESTIQTSEKEQGSLKKMVDFGREHPEQVKNDLVARAKNSLDKLLGEIVPLREEQKHLDAALALAEQARVVVEHTTHSGTEIQIGSKHWSTTEDRVNGVFRLKDGEIDYGSV